MTLDELLWQCFRHFVTIDISNAALHCAAVRYSPITFRVAEQLEECNADVDALGLPAADDSLLRLYRDVLAHRGTYAEDPGR